MKPKFDYSSGTALSAVVALSVAFLISATEVRAQSELELISGATTVTAMGVNGFVSTNVSVGNWNVTVDTGLAIPTDAPGDIRLNSVDLSSTGTSDSLTILWSGSGYTQTGNFLASMGGTLDTAGITATFSSYYGSLLSTATLLTGPISFGPYGGSTPFSGSDTGTTAGPGPFALTEQVVVTGGTSPNSQLSFQFDVDAVPEPSTIVLLLTGGSALALRRSKGKKLEHFHKSYSVFGV